MTIASVGCLGAGLAENQRMLERQQAELERQQRELALLRQGAPRDYGAAPKCDTDVLKLASRRGGERFAAGEFNTALGYYQDAASACPSSAESEFNVARTYEALNQADLAEEHYRRAGELAAGADAAAVQQAREALDRIRARR